jgi:hypothetical protein
MKQVDLLDETAFKLADEIIGRTILPSIATEVTYDVVLDPISPCSWTPHTILIIDIYRVSCWKFAKHKFDLATTSEHATIVSFSAVTYSEPTQNVHLYYHHP